jgi:hypothetical protein
MTRSKKNNKKQAVLEAALYKERKAQHKARVAKRVEKGISKNPADWIGAFRSGGSKRQPRLAQPTVRILEGGLPSLGRRR